jgi:hypothetical protein
MIYLNRNYSQLGICVLSWGLIEKALMIVEIKSVDLAEKQLQAGNY